MNRTEASQKMMELAGVEKIYKAHRNDQGHWEHKCGYSGIRTNGISRFEDSDYKAIDRNLVISGIISDSDGKLRKVYQSGDLDNPVNKVLKVHGCKFSTHGQDEWFTHPQIGDSIEEADKWITAALNEAYYGVKFNLTRIKNYAPRKGSQDEAIKLAKELYNSGHIQMLMNAKCRFGKTMTGYWILKELFPKGGDLFVTTCMPSNTKKAWKEDCQEHIDFEDFDFFDYHEKDCIQNFENSKAKYRVLFCSLQTSNREDEDEEENIENLEVSFREFIDSIKWSLCIIDESHCGTGTVSNRTYIRNLQTKFKIFMTGTAANEIGSGQFSKEEVFTWDYLDEQNLKETWKNKYPNEFNPYETMPQMRFHIISCDKFFTEKQNFTLTDFFNAEKDKEGNWKFINGRNVEEFIRKLCVETAHPLCKYSSIENRCGLWKLPYRKASFAMRELFHNVPELDKKFDVIMLNDDNPPSVEEVREFIDNSKKEYVLMFTYSRFCTGVTISQCDHVMIMTGGTTGNEYWQTIFRAGSPSIRDHFNVYDFDYGRMMEQVINEIGGISYIRKDFSCNQNKLSSYEDVEKEWIHCAPILEDSSLNQTDIKNYQARMKKELQEYKTNPIQFKTEWAKRIARLITKEIVYSDFYIDPKTKEVKKGKTPKGAYNIGKLKEKEEKGTLDNEEKKILSEVKRLQKEEKDKKVLFTQTIFDSLFYGYIYGNGQLTIESYLKSFSDNDFIPLQMYRFLKKDKSISNDQEVQIWMNEVENFFNDDLRFKTEMEKAFGHINNRHDKYDLLSEMRPENLIDETGNKRFPTPLPIIEKMVSEINFKDIDTVLDPCCISGEFLRYLKDKKGISEINLYGICDNEKNAIISRFTVFGNWKKNPNRIVVGNILTDNLDDLFGGLKKKRNEI